MLTRITAVACLLLLTLASLSGCHRPHGSPQAGGSRLIEDANLELAIRECIAKPDGALTLSDLTPIVELNASNKNIGSLEGIQNCVNLRRLYLTGDEIRDITPLSSLTFLEEVTLMGNQVSDLSPLSGLSHITGLGLDHNNIADLSPLETLTELQSVTLAHNRIRDLSSLSGLPNLHFIGLFQNRIVDLSPLVRNDGIDEGDYLSVKWNPLSQAAITVQIPELQSRGVTVSY